MSRAFVRLAPVARRRALVVAVLVGVIAATAATAWRRARRAQPATPLAALRASVSGCAALVLGPPVTCELDERRSVRVVVEEGARASFSASTDAGPATLDPPAIVGSDARLVVRAPPRATALTIESTGPTRGTWSIRVADASLPEWLASAREARREGDMDRARALAAAHVADGGASAAFAKGVLGRVAMRAGDYATAARDLGEAGALHVALGRPCDAGADRQARIFVLVERMNDLTAARAAIDEMDRDAGGCPDLVAAAPYSRFLLARALGDVRGATRAAEEERARASRLGLVADARTAQNALSILAAESGRTAEACALTRPLVYGPQASDDPCERAARMTGLAVLALDDEETRGNAVPACAEDARTILDDVIALARTSCADDVLLANGQVEMARARLHAGDAEGARAALAEVRARRVDTQVDIAVASLLVEGGLAVRAGRWREAAARYGDAEELARRLAWPGARARATAGLAASLEAAHDVRGALTAYARAEDALDDASLLVPLGAGRSTFVASSGASARSRIALLAAQGDARGALAAIEQARARLGRGLALRSALANLDDAGRARWESAVSAHRAARAAIEADVARESIASADEGARLRERRRATEAVDAGAFESTVAELVGRSAGPSAPPASALDDALVLALHPARSGWVGVAARAGHADVRLLASPDGAARPDAIAAGLLAPFDDVIATTARVRFALPPRALDDVPLHLLPFRGAPLIASVEVEHSVAASPIAGPSPCDGAESLRALVVSDPAGDLPAARLEAAEVMDRLRARDGGADVQDLAQAAATGAAVRAALPRAHSFITPATRPRPPKAHGRGALAPRFDPRRRGRRPRAPRRAGLRLPLVVRRRAQRR